MNTRERTREQISALVDGELADRQVDCALAALRQEDARADWDLYHQIGDVLRSDDMALGLSSGFAARMAARLDEEPTIIAPVAGLGEAVCEHGKAGTVRSAARMRTEAKRWALPGMVAAAAMATVAYVATPQLLVAMKDGGTDNVVPSTAVAALPVPASTAEVPAGTVVTASAPEGVVLRDARIDDYLLAHQRFSPSVYSTAQYARSATFATDTNK